LNLKGFDTTAIFRDYVMELETAIAQDTGAANLSFAPRPGTVLIGYDNIPDSGYGAENLLMAVARQKNGSASSRANVASLPAPVGGWNARDSLANMAPTDAVQLVKFFPWRVKRQFARRVYQTRDRPCQMMSKR
jgi:hypothetical protein